MNKKKQTTVLRLLSGAMTLLGFAACGDEIGGEEWCEYGTPNVDYQVRGTVTGEDGSPLEGIRVIVAPESDSSYGCDTTYTDARGEFTTRTVNGFSIGSGATYFDDVDGPSNGGIFESASVEHKLMNTKQVKKGSGNWYAGTYELTPKEPVRLRKSDAQDGQEGGE